MFLFKSEYYSSWLGGLHFHNTTFARLEKRVSKPAINKLSLSHIGELKEGKKFHFF